MSAAMEVGPVNLAVARALKEGLRLAEAGYYLTPVTITRTDKGDKLARFHAKWRTDGGWSADAEQIRDWSVQHSCSFAIVCGPSGVEGVDLDVKPDRGVDAVAWWANEGLPFGLLIVGTPSTGLHTYWRRRRSGRRLPTSAGEVAPGVDTRSVGGLFFAPGAFVLDTDGNPEEVGYTIQGPLVKVEDLTLTPDEVLDAWATPTPEPSVSSGEPDDDRRYTMDQAAKYVREQGVAKLQEASEGARNNALNDAALVFGHFVPAFWSQDEVTGWLTELAEEKGLDPREIGPTIRSGLRAGMVHPYTRVEADPFASASDSSGAESDAFETEVARKVRELKIVEEARRRLSEERNSYRPRIADNVVDDLDDIEPPAMLLGSLIPENAIGFIAGRSGAYKSFLAVGWGCCIATGRAWLGKPEFTVRRPLKTLYVAAEGLAGAVGRIRAWEAATGVSRRNRLMVHKRPIHLNDPAQVDELAAYITKYGFEFVIIDTYHRAAPGVDENNSTEFSVVFAAAARLRDDCNCGVLFVDHTGHAGNGRPRGSSAKGDDADYVLSSGYEGTARGSDVQRTLTVLKLKDEESGAEWPIRLTPVEGQHFPVVDIGTVNEAGPFGLTEDLNEWWRADRLPEIPPRVAEAIAREAAKCDNRGADAARWVWRYLAFVDDEQGLTRTQILNALQLIPRDRPFGKTAVDKAYPLLDHAGLVGRDKSRVWLLP